MYKFTTNILNCIDIFLGEERVAALLLASSNEPILMIERRYWTREELATLIKELEGATCLE